MAPPKQKAASYELIETGRALVRDPRILILDEATSALDTTTERAIQHSLTEASKGRTTLVVAHRLSTIIDADEIIVLRDGRAVERGTHAVLAKKQKGLYAGLWKAQSVTRTVNGTGQAAPRRRDISRRRSAGATSIRPARLVARFRGNGRSSAPSPCRRLGPPSRTTTT